MRRRNQPKVGTKEHHVILPGEAGNIVDVLQMAHDKQVELHASATGGEGTAQEGVAMVDGRSSETHGTLETPEMAVTMETTQSVSHVSPSVKESTPLNVTEQQGQQERQLLTSVTAVVDSICALQGITGKQQRSVVEKRIQQQLVEQAARAVSASAHSVNNQMGASWDALTLLQQQQLQQLQQRATFGPTQRAFTSGQAGIGLQRRGTASVTIGGTFSHAFHASQVVGGDNVGAQRTNDHIAGIPHAVNGAIVGETHARMREGTGPATRTSTTMSAPVRAYWTGSMMALYMTYTYEYMIEHQQFLKSVSDEETNLALFQRAFNGFRSFVNDGLGHLNCKHYCDTNALFFASRCSFVHLKRLLSAVDPDVAARRMQGLVRQMCTVQSEEDFLDLCHRRKQVHVTWYTESGQQVCKSFFYHDLFLQPFLKLTEDRGDGLPLIGSAGFFTQKKFKGAVGGGGGDGGRSGDASQWKRVGNLPAIENGSSVEGEGAVHGVGEEMYGDGDIVFGGEGRDEADQGEDEGEEFNIILSMLVSLVNTQRRICDKLQIPVQCTYDEVYKHAIPRLQLTGDGGEESNDQDTVEPDDGDHGGRQVRYGDELAKHASKETAGTSHIMRPRGRRRTIGQLPKSKAEEDDKEQLVSSGGGRASSKRVRRRR